MRVVIALLSLGGFVALPAAAQGPADRDYAGEAMPFADFMSYASRIRSGASKTPAGAPKDITVFDVQDQTASASPPPK